jgi:hypothetical protein
MERRERFRPSAREIADEKYDMEECWDWGSTDDSDIESALNDWIESEIDRRIAASHKKEKP